MIVFSHYLITDYLFSKINHYRFNMSFELRNTLKVFNLYDGNRKQIN